MKKYDKCSACGGKKRSVAALCSGCRKGNPSEKTIRKNRESSKARRVRFDELILESFTRDAGGRYRSHYWADDATRRTKLYRYQWIWIKEKGRIPPGFDVHHKNEVKDDDRFENLELKTHAEHASHHMRQSHPNAKLSLEQIREIRESGESGASLARKFGLNRSTVNRARHGRAWAYEPEGVLA